MHPGIPKTVDAPIMSNNVMKFKVLPHLEKEPAFCTDRQPSFRPVESDPPIFAEFRIQEEDTFYSILPTATQYARNAIFAGLLPIDIEKQFQAGGRMMTMKEVKPARRTFSSGAAQTPGKIRPEDIIYQGHQ